MGSPSIYGGSGEYRVGKPRRRPGLIIALLSVGAVVAIGAFIMFRQSAAAPQPSSGANEVAKEIEDTPAAKPKVTINAKGVQSAIDSWVRAHPGTYSVVVTDASSGSRLASTKPDSQYFTASIYKLYVAYEGYRKVDDGIYSASQMYLNGWDRGKCLDQMIRTSNSPCAEMWVELGKESLNTALIKYGLDNTSMTGLYTTAADAAIMLNRIYSGKGLSEGSRSKLLDSMKEQIYRDGLPKGFAGVTIYDKVGFREQVEYHDVAIVNFGNGKKAVVSVMTKNAGAKNIAGLATAIQKAVNT